MTGAQRLVFVGTDGGATTSKVGAVWADGTTVSTQLLQRPTGSAGRPAGRRHSWVERDRRLPRAERPRLGPGRRRRTGDPGSVPALRGVRQVAQPAGELRRLRRAHRLRGGPGRARRPAVPLVVGNDGNMGGVAEAQRVRGNGDRDGADARARLGPGLRLRRRQRPAARRRHPRGHGGGAHAGAAAPARRQAVPLRLRPDLGLRRGLHDAVRPAPTSWPSAPARRTRSARVRSQAAALPCAASPRRATRWRCEIFDFQARALGPPRRQPGDGARSRSSSSSAAA